MPNPRKTLDVNQVFAYRLRDVRLSKDWDQRRLAEEMARLGFPSLTGSAISKIEAGRFGVGGEWGDTRDRKARTVSLAESIAFAVALDVSPVSLFLPLTRADDVQLAPAQTTDVETAYRWIRGDHPLKEEDRDAVAFYRFQSHERVLAKPRWP